MSETAVSPQTLPSESTYPETGHSLRSALAAEGLMNKVFALMEWFYNTRVGRTLNRYSLGKGSVLAGGIAYMSMFSIFAALAIGITVLMMLVGSNEQLRDAIFSAISQALPGVLTWKGEEGILKPQDLILDTGFSVTGIIATGVLVFSATYVMSALKWAIRQMFGIVALPINFVFDLLRDLGAFVIMMLAVVITAVAGIVSSTAGSTILGWLGLNGSFASFMLQIASLVIAALVDAAVLYFLIRWVAGVRVPRPDMLKGLALGVVGSAVLRFLGTSAVGSVKSPLLASFAALVTVLLWVNLLARLVLYMAAFMANPPRPQLPTTMAEIHAEETPNYITLSVPHTLSWPHQTITGTIESDPDADPNRVVAEPVEPYWGGLIGQYLQWQVKRHKRKAVEYHRALYNRRSR